VRTQQEAEAIVDVENIQNKYETSVLANNYSQEPKTYEEAMSAPDAIKWKEAINKEGVAIQTNGTWKLVKRPTGKKVLTSMWVVMDQ
jgi:hypothetical protein